MIPASDIHVKEKANEVPIIEMADTVIYPWTMVVHSRDATVALSAMMGPWRLVPFASAAEARVTC